MPVHNHLLWGPEPDMAGEKSDRAKPLRIRKYPNRRYYDSTRSRHVTLEDIHSLIRDGYEVEVTDSKTGVDITAKVLAQIILDLDPPKLAVFPVPLLHELIRSNEELVQDFIDKYFSRALSAFLASQKQFEAHMRQMLGLGAEAPPSTNWAQLMLAPFSPQFWTGVGQSHADASQASRPAEEGDENVRQAVEELRQQVAALQAELAKRKK